MKAIFKNISIVWVIRRTFALILFFYFAEVYQNAPLFVGENGLVSFGPQMSAYLDQHGLLHSFLNFPTLFWFNHSDHFLRMVALSGIILSFLVLLSVEWFVFDLLIWIIYASFLQIFTLFTDLSDYVVMECAFLFIFLFPWKSRPVFNSKPVPLKVTVLGFYFFIFKLSLGMFFFKLLSNSPLWKNLTFLKVFYPNSPVPGPLAYFLYQFPMWFQKWSTLLVFVLQFATALFVFTPRKFRKIAFFSVLLLQVPILFSSNLGVTNITVILISFFLLLNLDELKTIDFKKSLNVWIIGIYIFFGSTLLISHFRRGEDNHLSRNYLYYKSPEQSGSFLEKAEIYLYRYKVNYILARFYDIYNNQRDLAFAYSSDGKKFQEGQLLCSLGKETKAPAFLWGTTFCRLRLPLFYFLQDKHLLTWRGSFYDHFPWYRNLIRKAYLEADSFNENFLRKKVVCENDCRYFKLRHYRYEFTSIDELFATGRWWNRTLISESEMIDMKNPPAEFPKDLRP